MKDTKKIVRQNDFGVTEAKTYLERILQDKEDLHLKGVTYEDSYTRYHFYKENDKRVIYTVVSKEEIEDSEELETFAV